MRLEKEINKNYMRREGLGPTHREKKKKKKGSAKRKSKMSDLKYSSKKKKKSTLNNLSAFRMSVSARSSYLCSVQ